VRGKAMSKEKMFERVMNNRCPISDRPIKGEDTEVVSFGEAKLVVITQYIKFKKEKR
jgi:hypothetical protein